MSNWMANLITVTVMGLWLVGVAGVYNFVSRFAALAGASALCSVFVLAIFARTLARSSTSNRQDAESRGFTGVLGALATLRGILLPAH
jgi:membrane protein implicated in regulation of membrane protease activity